jgi:hypothetical protein
MLIGGSPTGNGSIAGACHDWISCNAAIEKSVHGQRFSSRDGLEEAEWRIDEQRTW